MDDAGWSPTVMMVELEGDQTRMLKLLRLLVLPELRDHNTTTFLILIVWFSTQRVTNSFALQNQPLSKLF